MAVKSLGPVKIDKNGEASLIAKAFEGITVDDVMQLLEKLAQYGPVVYKIVVELLLLLKKDEIPIFKGESAPGCVNHTGRLADALALQLAAAAATAEHLACCECDS